MLPAGWEECSVGALFEVQLGKMLNKEAKKKHPQFPYLTNFNVRWGRFDLSDVNTMYFSEKDKKKFSLVCGDLIVCEGGEVGRCAIWKNELTPCYYQKALHRLRSKGNIFPQYFQFYMEFIAGTKLIGDYTGRTSIAHLTREKLIRLPVNVPPLWEQTKIVNSLSTWDKAIESIEKLIENSRAQKGALMQQLLTGKKRLSGFENRWGKVSINKMGRIISGGTPESGKQSYWDKGIAWATPTDITALKSRHISKTKRTISPEGVKNSSAQLLPPGSILVCTRATIGYLAIASSEITTNQGFKSLIPNENFDSEFIYYLFKYYKNKFVRYASGSTFLEISKKDFSKLTFNVPKIDEQKQIAKILNNAGDSIRKLESYRDCLLSEKKALMQQLLTGKRRVNIEKGRIKEAAQ